jgi:hypothetical protein
MRKQNAPVPRVVLEANQEREASPLAPAGTRIPAQVPSPPFSRMHKSFTSRLFSHIVCVKTANDATVCASATVHRALGGLVRAAATAGTAAAWREPAGSVAPIDDFLDRLGRQRGSYLPRNLPAWPPASRRRAASGLAAFPERATSCWSSSENC